MAKINPIGMCLVEAKSKSPNTRVDALSGLSAIQFTRNLKPATDKQITDAFLAALNDTYPRVRAEAILGLAVNNNGGKQIMDVLSISLKKDGSNMSSDALTEALGHMCATKYGINTVGRMLADKEFPKEVRSVCATKLGDVDASQAGMVKKYLQTGANDPETSISVFSRLSLAKLNALTAEQVNE